MTSKECLKRIDEKYYLTERERKEFLSVIEKDLARLEELERFVEILKKYCYFRFNTNSISNMIAIQEEKEQECDYTCIFPNKEDFNFLKEVLEHE